MARNKWHEINQLTAGVAQIINGLNESVIYRTKSGNKRQRHVSGEKRALGGGAAAAWRKAWLKAAGIRKLAARRQRIIWQKRSCVTAENNAGSISIVVA